MDTALPQKFPFILDRNLAKANSTENRVCPSCDTVGLAPWYAYIYIYMHILTYNYLYKWAASFILNMALLLHY